MIRFPMLLIFLAILPSYARAQDSTVKDSVYFTMDDGVESPREMEEEAGYVHDVCSRNPYESLYFNCDCLAGAFLNEREKAGPTMPQIDIIDKITNSAAATCANTDEIAGRSYDDCISYRKNFYELSSDAENADFCSCVANKFARDFSKSPRLSTGVVSQFKLTAMSYCENPQNRPKKQTASGSAAPAAAELAPQSKIPPKTVN